MQRRSSSSRCEMRSGQKSAQESWHKLEANGTSSFHERHQSHLEKSENAMRSCTCRASHGARGVSWEKGVPSPASRGLRSRRGSRGSRLTSATYCRTQSDDMHQEIRHGRLR
eukprot:6428855-Pyramimonas_sp.AAC.1